MNKNEIQLRPANSLDKKALLILEQAVVEAERPFNPQIRSKACYYDLEDLLENDLSHVIVALHNEEIIATGYVQIRTSKKSLTHNKHGYLGFMFVSPEYRGHGLNQRIIKTLMNWAESKGIYDFYLDVYKDNEAAIKAYEKLGFEPSLLEMKVNTEKQV
ncbi:GNAT family N-acetyltransferase [Pseudoalteromonas luteoviolacea]|uniref:N-acetyltransferase domain-containing protein n=1 Tax=Pseudoalteromonas luteoviolacea DSM 6061 TaxID=1365250 RepID=A0A166U9D4_9GAMM|nr:GNAT family N-acetyltransferase [Pseudoalteromonas luteoviolacea]KZN29696.1 hypothetical protein N475_05205 [Pseudoalteromonas luteoviolacea DSM 6061]KZN53255.1 hypothetical protein N474_21330 [Pseudoalteromonas luteoviolacea CPMOR-2]MBE0389413.1 hypothetical protein [Pseudoalteromonas luteoviolacea DSM 6061]TQF67910.1 GNAT family N-acetyltransferase [Pseudoalteromonas luteoviolacea]